MSLKRIKISNLPQITLWMMNTTARKSAEVPGFLLSVNRNDTGVIEVLVSHGHADETEQYFIDSPIKVKMKDAKVPVEYVGFIVKVIRCKPGDPADQITIRSSPLAKPYFEKENWRDVPKIR